MSTKQIFSPYGAFEMKVSYQKNMLIGNLTAISIFLMVAFILWISTTTNPIVEVDTKDFDGTIYDFFNSLDQIDANSLRQPGRRPEIHNRGSIPVAIPDSEYIEFDEPELISITEYDEQDYGVGEFIDDSSFGSGGDFGGVYDGPDEIYPEENQFVPFEKEPVLYEYKEPDYPRLCKLANIEGVVVMKVLVGKDGLVKKALVAKSSGVEAFDIAALSVAKENKFTPALQNSIPISLWVTYKVEFKIR